MKNIMKNIVLWSAAIVLFSCAKTDLVDDNALTPGENKIEIGAKLIEAKVKTKALEDPTPNMFKGVGVIIDDVTTGSVEIYKNERYTGVSDGTSGQLVLHNTNNQLYWQNKQQTLNFYAYAPFANGTETPTKIKVTADQYSIYDESAYENQDFLYAKLEGKKFADRRDLYLPFEHRMSKVAINLIKGDNMTDAELATATVKLVDLYTEADFDIRTGLTTAYTKAENIRPRKKTNTSHEAYLIPQEVDNSDDFAEIKVGTQTYYFAMNKGAAGKFAFDQGTRYVFNVTVHSGKIVMTYSIEEWEDGGSKDINEDVIKDYDLALKNPNCYIVKVGESIEIPVSKVFAMWEVDPRLKKALADKGLSELSGNDIVSHLIWQDAQGVIYKNLKISGTKKDAKIKCEAGTTPGNVVVAVWIDGILSWSWHIWVTADDPATWPTYSYDNNADGIDDYVFMDRNLGASSVTVGNPGAKGLYYQWGRKDPYTGTSDWSSTNYTTMYNEGGVKMYPDKLTGGIFRDTNPGANRVALAVIDPQNYFDVGTAVKDWCDVSYGDLWGAGGDKSPYDPCPEGWRVPMNKNGKYPLNGIANGTYDATSGTDFGPSLGYWPRGGARQGGETHLNTGANYIWTAESASELGDVIMCSSKQVTRQQTKKSSAIPVRCVKE